MVQGDTRNFSGPKRPRTDAPRNEGDWKCPNCGNLNYAFRTTCNMRNCSAPKPADPPKPFGGYVPGPYGQGQTALHMGTPAGSMYLGGQGTPPYGTSLAFGGASAIPYEMPYPGAAGMRYDYGSHLSHGGAYGPLHISSPYGPGAIVSPGAYGAGSIVDGYGMGMSMGRGALGLRPGMFPEENGSRKRRGDGLAEGDWLCPKCGNTNFSFRTVCNMRKCGTPKPNTGSKFGGSSKVSSKSTPPEGSWTCEKCGNINYPFRQKCNKSDCGAERPTDKNDSAKKQGDNEQ
eukprot:TRINITY_DN1518_c0_g1_i1.p1 TRINITY_DN1518_c0_g1~~TRINITY_DN1518_c0_g1_i1.p1  ORF type:complete len:288 (+),score=58.77 TRINITY_DN1518_c0_g1_i1:272-1135(+)